MNGPALSPKLPSNGGDSEVDARDVSASFLSPTTSFLTVIVNTPSVGEPSVESMIVITRTEGLAQEPT